MDKLLELYSVPTQSHEDREWLSGSITGMEIESLFKKSPIKEKPGTFVVSLVNSIKHSKT